MHARRLPFLLALGFLAGCGTGTVALQIPISGAETVPIDFANGSPLHAENDDIKIEKALLVPDAKAKKASYSFVFREKNKSDRPVYVKVEDVTDDVPATWVEDRNPRLKDGLWSWQSGHFPINESTTKWLFELENSIRVYRFTILTARRHTWVLYEGASYPGYVKTYVRQQFGLEASPANH